MAIRQVKLLLAPTTYFFRPLIERFARDGLARFARARQLVTRHIRQVRHFDVSVIGVCLGDAFLKRLFFFQRVELVDLPEAAADRTALHWAVTTLTSPRTKVLGRQVIVIHGVAMVELEHSHRLNELAHRARERQVRVHIEHPRFLEHQVRLARGNAMRNVENHAPYLRRQVHLTTVRLPGGKRIAG